MVDESALPSTPEEADGQYEQKPPPQFGQFEHEGFQPRPGQAGPAITVRNTFLDIDDKPPSPAQLARAHTTPPGYPAVDALLEAEMPGVPGFIGKEDGEDFDFQLTTEEMPPPLPQPIFRGRTPHWLENSEEEWADPELEQQAMTTGQHDASAAVAQTAMPSSMATYNGQPVQMVMMPMLIGADAAGGVPGRPAAAPSLAQPGQGAPWCAQQQPQVPPSSMQQQQQSLQLPSQQQSLHPQQPLQQQAESIRVETSAGGAGGERADDATGATASALAAPQPQTLTTSHCSTTGYTRVHWTVDARKLRGNDKQAVSPPFELHFPDEGPQVTFKMMIYPKAVNDAKGGASFKKARGRGFVQLKCEAEIPEAIANFRFRISIGSGTLQEPRGPVHHNFSGSAVGGLPKEQEEWDFSSVVHADSQTFIVCLEIQPHQTRT